MTILVERILVEWAPLGRLSGYPNTLDHGTGLLEPINVFGMELDLAALAGIPADVILAILVVLVVALYGYRNVSRSPRGAARCVPSARVSTGPCAPRRQRLCT